MAEKPLISVLFMLLLSSTLHAQGMNGSACEKLTTPNSLFWCLVKNKAEVKLQKAEVKVRSEAIIEALQRPNPELELEGIDNKNGGITSEASLLHTFELGDKRNSRKGVARAEKQISETRHLAEIEEAARDFAIKLHRLRQINTEFELASENLQTFRNIQKQYKSLGRLNPEQSISVSVFEIAEQETELKKESLNQERDQIISEFQAILGKDKEYYEKLLPTIKQTWPDISVQEIKNSTRTLLNDEVNLANANLDLARSEAWPDLAIGPKIEHQTGDINETTFGLALTLPLPLLNTNQGGRAKASSQLQRMELQRKLLSDRLSRYKDYLLKSYESSSKAVQRALKGANIQKRHGNLHKLLNRGIVSSALVIEMHREVFDFYERLHEHELKAVDALWRLYALRGTLVEEEL